MKEPMDILKVYNLVDANGNWLKLKLGRIKDYAVTRANPDKGFRWSFDGTKIPMPVRVRTWFNGFPEETMLDWLKANGWYPRTCVIPNSGTAIVYDLPDEFDKANESLNIDNATLERLREIHGWAFERTIRLLVEDDRAHLASCIYIYAHGCSVGEATKAVKEICGE